MGHKSFCLKNTIFAGPSTETKMLVKIYPENPNPKEVRRVVEILREGGVIIYPTDTVYGMGCDIYNHKAVERLARLKGISLQKANFSFICHDLSNLAEYARQISKPVFKVMKKHLPGPFTFILPASASVPNIFKSRKKTIGIRVPNNPIVREIVRELGNPILSTSIKALDGIAEYLTDPELIYEAYQDKVDLVVDGGFGNNVASTVVDCTGEEMEIIREGAGLLDD